MSVVVDRRAARIDAYFTGLLRNEGLDDSRERVMKPNVVHGAQVQPFLGAQTFDCSRGFATAAMRLRGEGSIIARIISTRGDLTGWMSQNGCLIDSVRWPA